MQVTVWNEYVHERQDQRVAEVYPQGIHQALVSQLEGVVSATRWQTATLDQPEHGLSEDVLHATDVLLWWGHLAHDQVDDRVAAKVCERVQQGMGLIVLHSAHLSKPFVRLMGTTCNLRWRESDDREVVWTVAPQHPICQGVSLPIVLDQHETYGEFFDIPAPDELVFVSSFSGGEVFRSGCCFQRGKGRVFYFSPGHETYPIYYQPQVVQVLGNAVRWAYQAQRSTIETATSPEVATGWFLD